MTHTVLVTFSDGESAQNFLDMVQVSGRIYGMEKVELTNHQDASVAHPFTVTVRPESSCPECGENGDQHEYTCEMNRRVGDQDSELANLD